MPSFRKDLHPFSLEGLSYLLGPDNSFAADLIAMYLERLKRILSTEEGLHLTFSSGDSEESIELSREAAIQMLRAVQVMTNDVVGEGQLTLSILGHQVVRAPECYGLLLRTQEVGDVVFSLPQAILQRLISDLTHLASSPPILQTSGDARGKTESSQPPANRRR
jgi:hypothetical protein